MDEEHGQDDLEPRRVDTSIPPGRRGWLIGMAVAVAMIVVGFALLVLRDDGNRGGDMPGMPGMEMGRRDDGRARYGPVA